VNDRQMKNMAAQDVITLFIGSLQNAMLKVRLNSNLQIR